ncbi:hypothetical protein [Erwinia tasmaniensis]|uniref:hypothetical protein n=1 Tax=Erwinia tasmaniensis TaxID=338565 RepID=UPI0005B317A0|nr:hypothetical protein [Erwinia tasmaniensis]
MTEFIDTFYLFNLEHEVGSENLKTFQTLADKYSHLLSEAEKEVEEKEAEAFYGIRPSDYEFLTE